LLSTSENEKSRLDEAARAGWLYFIAGHTQDEIAKMLQVSRASAQRLVSLCLAERLITFRLEHPIAACMELAARVKDLFHLVYCEVVPTDPAAPLSAAGIAERAANVSRAVHGFPDPVRHEPRATIRSEAEHPLQLQGAKAFLRCCVIAETEHPLMQRDMAAL